MKQQLRGKELFLVGVTLFSMFFGAGNLIFPPFVGYQAGAAALPAFLGMALTAVCFPVLGVVAVAKVGGTDKLCSKIHPYFAIVFTILVYLCIGPMLAIPRTASTSYSMFAFLTARLDGMTLAGIPIDWVLRTVFSLAFFAGAYQLAKRPAHFKDVLGKWMTPVLLVMIAVMFAAGLFYLKDAPAAPQQAYADGAFMKGFVEGYNTMDTLAAIVFGIVIALNVQACGVSEKKAVARSIMKAGVIAGVFLFTVYGLLAWLGAHGSAVLAQAADGTAVLSGLCLQFFGPVGALLLAAIFFVACFNVCTGLLSSCAAFFHEKFPRFSFIRWLQTFTVVSFLVSILGLELILKISVPILTLLYPVAIAIIVINLLPFAWAQKPVVHRVVTVLAFAVSIWSMF